MVNCSNWWLLVGCLRGLTLKLWIKVPCRKAKLCYPVAAFHRKTLGRQKQLGFITPLPTPGHWLYHSTLDTNGGKYVLRTNNHKYLYCTSTSNGNQLQGGAQKAYVHLPCICLKMAEDLSGKVTQI